MVYALPAVPLAFLGLRYLYCLGSDGAGTLLGGDAPTLRLPFYRFRPSFSEDPGEGRGRTGESSMGLW